MVIQLLLLVVVISAVWVYMDAKARDWTGTKYETSTPGWWGLMTGLVWVIYFPWYMAARRHAQPREAG
jgi:hypothetical protein